MENIPQHPRGDMLLQTLAMPADTNPAGDIFGGWIMSQMDIAGGILAREIAQCRIVTVAVDSFRFFKPVHIGDVVCCYGEVLKVGTTSLSLNLEVWVKSIICDKDQERMSMVTQATFIYVAVDDDGKKKPIGSTSCPLP